MSIMLNGYRLLSLHVCESVQLVLLVHETACMSVVRIYVRVVVCYICGARWLDNVYAYVSRWIVKACANECVCPNVYKCGSRCRCSATWAKHVFVSVKFWLGRALRFSQMQYNSLAHLVI